MIIDYNIPDDEGNIIPDSVNPIYLSYLVNIGYKPMIWLWDKRRQYKVIIRLHDDKSFIKFDILNISILTKEDIINMEIDKNIILDCKWPLDKTT